MNQSHTTAHRYGYYLNDAVHQWFPPRLASLSRSTRNGRKADDGH